MTFESPTAYWDRQSQIGGPLPAIIAALPADEVAEIRATVVTALQQYATRDGHALPSSLLVAAAS